MTTTLHFTGKMTGQRSVPRRVYSAKDGDTLYTFGINTDGTDAIAMVGRWTPAWETLHFRSFVGTPMHADELKDYLQSFADRLEVTV